MLIYLFAVYLKWLPPSGRISVDLGFGFKSITGVYVLDALLRWDLAALRDAIAHLILPALTLGTIPLAIIARITRSAMLEVLSQDYIRTARAKGLAGILGDFETRFEKCVFADRHNYRFAVRHSFRRRYSD
jgi:ABC-type dipeptide/oligopeptide/nickel transport systems, permease components